MIMMIVMLISDIKKHFKHTERFIKIKSIQYFDQFSINIVIVISLVVFRHFFAAIKLALQRLWTLHTARYYNHYYIFEVLSYCASYYNNSS